MNKSELVASVAEKTGLTKKAAEGALAAVLGSIEESLVKGDKVQLIGFGTFGIKKRAARTGRNPATGEAMTFAASNTPVFKAAKAFKEKVN